MPRHCGSTLPWSTPRSSALSPVPCDCCAESGGQVGDHGQLTSTSDTSFLAQVRGGGVPIWGGGCQRVTCCTARLGVTSHAEMGCRPTHTQHQALTLPPVPLPPPSWQVLDVKKAAAGQLHVHTCNVQAGQLRVGQQVAAVVDEDQRRRLRAHHTATHLLQSALKQVGVRGGRGGEVWGQGCLLEQQGRLCRTGQLGALQRQWQQHLSTPATPAAPAVPAGAGSGHQPAGQPGRL
jgi:hypothetical protein